MPLVAEQPKAPNNPQPAITQARSAMAPPACDNADKMLCERCGADMYRMHAVWRCSACGFKTDCCGW